MAKKPSSRYSEEQVQEFVQTEQIKTMEAVQSALKDLFSVTAIMGVSTPVVITM